MDPNEERFGTHKEKSLKLHQELKKPITHKKVRKEIEAFAKIIGITKEVVSKAREENILSEEKTLKKEASLEAPKLKKRQTRSDAPSSGTAKPESKPKSLVKPSGGVHKRKLVRFVVDDDEGTKSDEVVKEVKAKDPKATKIKKEKPFGRNRSSKKPKSKIAEAFKQGNYTIIPPITLDQIVNAIVKDGNFKPLSKWYENFDEFRKRTLVEATVVYLNVYSKSQIELITVILKSLYDILDA